MSVAYAKIHKLDLEIEVQCSGDQFYDMFAHNMKEVPKRCPHLCQSFEVLEGDGSVGTVQAWKFVLDGKSTNLKEIVKAMDDEKRMITHGFIGGEVMNGYNSLEKTLTVTPKGTTTGDDDGRLGSLVKWSIEYEKANEDASAPTVFADFMVSLTNSLNVKLQNHV